MITLSWFDFRRRSHALLAACKEQAVRRKRVQGPYESNANNASSCSNLFYMPVQEEDYFTFFGNRRLQLLTDTKIT